jgi:hypothetical protein
MSLAETALTALRTFSTAPGLGLGTTVTEEPSQCSIRVRWPCSSESVWPTIQTSVADSAATPKSSESSTSRSGWGTSLHTLPFQRRISTTGPGWLSTSCSPTAQTSLWARAETAWSSPSSLGGG